MLKVFKLDWKHFMIDFVQNPGITCRRVFEILKTGTSVHKAAKIRSALFAENAPYAVQYPEEMAYLKKLPAGQIDVVPYPLKGKPIDVTVQYDQDHELYFVEHDGKRLYFAGGMSEQDCETCYRSLLEGEDIFGRGRVKSPHCYEDAEHRVNDGDIVMDVGCAEGLFALDVAQRSGRIYLFEQLPRWKRPLELSFAPYRGKTQIVNKAVAARTEGDYIRLTDAIQGGNGDEVYFIKLDIEGWEETVLRASEDFLRSHKVKISCCAYHRQNDADDISRFLAGIGFDVRFSEGYMLPPLHKVSPPYFRKGMIYARNFKEDGDGKPKGVACG